MGALHVIQIIELLFHRLTSDARAVCAFFHPVERETLTHLRKLVPLTSINLFVERNFILNQCQFQQALGLVAGS